MLTNKLLVEAIFKLFHNEYLDQHHDGAVFELNGPTAFSTDSFVVSPIFFPGGNIGERAVNGTVNDLAMCGAIPRFLSLSLILEEGLKIEDLWRVLVSAKEASERSGVQIVTGDTKVVDRGKGDLIFINTAGLGTLHTNAKIGFDRIKKGDVIVTSGTLANHGVAILSVREGLAFESPILSDTINLNHKIKSMLDDFGIKIHFLRDPTRGGVATVLNEIAINSKLGISIDEASVPVKPEVQGACEILGLDPIYIANEGIFLAIVSADISEKLLETMRSKYNLGEATIIGEIVEDHAGKVIMNSSIGGKRVVNMLLEISFQEFVRVH